jgi:UDP-glucose 4-epimerase
VKVLVTGSEGVFAQQVIAELITSGHTVIGVDNLSKHSKVKNLGWYTFIEGDLTNAIFTNSLFDNQHYDLVFHFAAIIYGVLWYDRYPADVLSKNIAMTSNILYNHKSMDKFIYISSSMVYERTTIYPSKEDDTKYVAIMSSDYGLSKFVGERLVEAYHKQHGLSYTIWRPFNIFDIKEKIHKEDGRGHVFSDLVRKILIDRQMPITLLGNGEQTRTFIDLRDASYAIANFSSKSIGTYNLGSMEEVTIKELATLIAEKAVDLGLLDSEYKLAFEGSEVHSNDVQRRIPDTIKLSAQFSWKPTIPLSTSIQDFLLTEWSY